MLVKSIVVENFHNVFTKNACHLVGSRVINWKEAFPRG